MNEAENKTVYILDTNTLIQFSVWLPIDLNKNFWAKFEEALENREWILLDVIVNEIRYGNDGLKNWCEVQKKKGLMRSIDDSHKERGAAINNTYKMIDETTGKSTGDTYLIAYAEINKLTVFSREAPRKNGDDLYKIPDVCKALGVPIIYRPKEFLEAIDYKNQIVSGDTWNPEEIMTPSKFTKAGTDRIVVGRPIVKSEKPYDVFVQTIEEIASPL